MTEQTQNTAAGSSWLDTVWLVAAVVLLLGGLIGYYWLGNETAMPIRVATVVGGLVLGVGAFAMSAYGRTLWAFASTSRVELRKMVWPTIPETRTITLIVFVFVLLLGIFFWGIDALLAWGTKSLLGGGA